MSNAVEDVAHKGESPLFARAYRVFAYLGAFSVGGAILFGFRFDPEAPIRNVVLNAALYVSYMIPHLVMTRGAFKRRVWGSSSGSPKERRVYVAIAVVWWWAVVFLQRPTPGSELELPNGVRLIGVAFFLYCQYLSNQGATFEMLDGLLGVPGRSTAYSHGPETPLFTAGQFAQVRHPMYRATILGCLASLLIHPNFGQLFWITLLSATFIGFIPVEEGQLLAARGEEYRRYQEQVPYRVFRGIW